MYSTRRSASYAGRGKKVRRRARSARLALMKKRLATILCLAALGLSLGGCTKCGWIWNDSPRSCRADAPQ